MKPHPPNTQGRARRKHRGEQGHPEEAESHPEEAERRKKDRKKIKIPRSDTNERKQTGRRERSVSAPKQDTLKDVIRIAMLKLRQRPPRYAGVGRSCSIAEAISWEMRSCDTIKHWGSATRSVDQYTHGRRLGQEKTKTNFEGGQEARALD